MKGKFVTFEGIEGSGKTTQIRLFAAYLQRRGEKVLVTREPGGTEVGDQIRQILLNPQNISILPKTELLLYAAARAQHVEEKIRPALNKGLIVLSDRYADASRAYQGAARFLPEKTLTLLHKIATNSLNPDITFLLDLPAAEGLKRARDRNQKRGREDRFENEGTPFHKKVREGYLKIAHDEPSRVFIIPVGPTPEETQEKIIQQWKKREKAKK